MKKVVVSDIFDLASRMLEEADGHAHICAVLFGEEAFELMRELLSCDLVSAGCIDISNIDRNDYNLEYYLTLQCDNMSLWVEPAWSKGDEYHEAGYLKNNVDVLFIDGGASYAIVKAQENPDCDVYQLEFCDEYYDCSECEECDYSDEDDDEYDDDVVDLISDLIGFFEGLFVPERDSIDDGDDHNKATSKEVIEFINRRFHDKTTWSSGNCYYFAVILNDRFPGGSIVYDVVNGHFLYLYDGQYYDQTGIVFPDDEDIVSWDDFDEYDCIQKKRIIRDCIK